MCRREGNKEGVGVVVSSRQMHGGLLSKTRARVGCGDDARSIARFLWVCLARWPDGLIGSYSKHEWALGVCFLHAHQLLGRC